MAKDQERNLAFFYFTKENMEAKDIAAKLKVRPNTVGDWIKKGNWKKIRDANINQVGERLDRIQQVIDELSNERLEIIKAKFQLFFFPVKSVFRIGRIHGLI